MTRGVVVAAAAVVVAVDDDVKEVACATIPAALLAAERRANAMGAGEGVLEVEMAVGAAAAAAAPTRCCCCGEGVEVLRIRRRGEKGRSEILRERRACELAIFSSRRWGEKKLKSSSRGPPSRALFSLFLALKASPEHTGRPCRTLPSALSASQSTGAAPLPTSMRRSTPMMIPSSPPTDNLLPLDLDLLLERSSSNSSPRTRPTTRTPRGKGSAASSRARRESHTLGTGPSTRAGSRR